MVSLLLPLVAPAFAADVYTSVLAQAKGSLLAGEYKDARDLLTAAEEAAPGSEKLITRKDLARLFFYRGVLYWRASPESAALDAWRQALTIAPDFEPEKDLLGDQADRDVFLALRDEVTARGEITLDLPEDPGEATIYVDGEPREPSDTVIAGSHFVQIRCEGGEIAGSWYAYGAPPKNYLVICDGGTYKTSSKESSSSKSSSSTKSSSSSKSSSSTKSSSTKSSSSSRDLDEKAEKGQKSGGAGKDIAGVTLLGLGVGGGVASVFLYDRYAQAAEAYDKKWAAGKDDADLKDAANAYYNDVMIPRYGQFWVGAGASGLLIAGGVVLIAVDAEGPMVAPLPGGGGMFTWSGRF